MEKINLDDVKEKLLRITADLEQAAVEKTAAHKVEQKLFITLLEMGFLLLQQYFRLCGTGDEGETKTMPDGRRLKRLSEPHVKPYLSIFGEIRVERMVYAQREGQKIEHAPLDAHLQLPESKYSYLLQEWSQSLSVDAPYAQVSTSLGRILNLKLGSHALERQNQYLAASTREFQNQQPTAPIASGDEVIISTADGKGIPIRSPQGGKKMSVIASCYTIPPYPRTPEEVLNALFSSPEDKPSSPKARPKPIAKYVRASFARDEDGAMQPSFDETFAWLAEEARHRNAGGAQQHIVVMDGQEALWNNAAEYLSENRVEILDLLHAMGYIRKASALFYSNEKLQELFAKLVAERLLHGRVYEVVEALGYWAKLRKLDAKGRREVRRIQGYFENHAHRMRYDQYLAAGYPIASGVIEGACRYVIKDRMERTGMRWTMAGAAAMLNLRCISVNDDWDEFMEFHIHRENQRLYPWKAAANDDSCPVLQLVA